MIVRFIWLVGPNVGLVFPESKLEGVLCETIEECWDHDAEVLNHHHNAHWQ